MPYEKRLRELERIRAGKEMALMKAKVDEAERKRIIEVRLCGLRLKGQPLPSQSGVWVAIDSDLAVFYRQAAALFLIAGAAA